MSYAGHHMEAGGAKPVSAVGLQAEQDRGALLLMLEYVRTATRADECAATMNQGSAGFLQASTRTTPQAANDPDPAARIRAECLQTGAVVDCEDTASDLLTDAEACRRAGIAAVVAAPVRREGRTVGVVEIHSAQAYNFMEFDIDVLQRVCDVIAALIYRKGSG